MASRLIPVRVDGVELLVEVVPVAGSEPTSTKLDKAQETVAEAFDRAQEAIIAVAKSTVGTVRQLGRQAARPDEMQVKFGLKFSAQGNVIVAGAAGEASLEVTLLYRSAESEMGDGAD